jgi:hypothetical protein
MTLQLVQHKRTVDPAQRLVRCKFGDGRRNVRASIPLQRHGVNLPAHFQHVGMEPEHGRDLVQFRVGLDVIAEV